MKKIKDHSDDDDFEVDDPDYPEDEGASEEEWTPAPEPGAESGTKIRPQRETAKKRQHSEEEDEEEEEEDEEEDEDEDEESDSDTGKKSKKKRRSKKDDDDKEEEDDEDSDDNSFNESGETPKDYTSGSFVLAKADLVSNKSKTSSKGKSDVDSSPYPTLWRIDGKALLQKFLPFEEEGKVLYKSTTTYSGWQLSNKDNYLAVQVSFKVQSRQETIVELHFDPTQQQEVVKDDKED